MTGATLVVSEIFGPTFQGEGPSTGQRAGFVRLGRCNLACSWCDTPYTWDWKRYNPATELHRLTVGDVMERLTAMAVELVVVTGGEPLLQQHALTALIEALRAKHWRVEVETAGTIAPDPEIVAGVTRFNVSPKLANSGNPTERRFRPEVLRALESTGRASFKFVARDEGDLDEIAAIVEECRLGDVWVMPEGTAAADVSEGMRVLADPVIARGWNLTTRMHVLLWGDERGR